MTGFKLRISGVGSNHSTNRATTTFFLRLPLSTSSPSLFFSPFFSPLVLFSPFSFQSIFMSLSFFGSLVEKRKRQICDMKRVIIIVDDADDASNEQGPIL